MPPLSRPYSNRKNYHSSRRTKAAMRIQRKYRAKYYSSGPKRRPPGIRNLVAANKYNREIKSIESSIVNNLLVANAGSQVNGPSNSLVILPVHMLSAIGSGTGNNEVVGSWLVPRFCQIKYTVVADGVNPINVPFVNVFETYGYMKITPEKFNADRSSAANWTAAVLAEVKKELYDNGFDSDYCTWQQKSRDLVLWQNKAKLHFSQASKAVSANSLTGSGTGVSDIAPPICRTIDFEKIMGHKTKLEIIGSGARPDQVCGNMWVPFVMLTCSQLISGEHMTVKNASKFYFSDP